MRLFTSCLLSTLLLPVVTAKPLSFEQRSPDRFVAHFGNTNAVFRRGEVSIESVTMRFRGSSKRVRLEGAGRLRPARIFCRDGGGRLQYPRLALRNLYPGVDAIFYGNGVHLEYDLMIAPHARLENIQLVFEGAEQLGLDKDGGLRVEAGSAVLEQRLPRVFQADGREVSVRYALLSGNRVAIRLGPHNASHGLLSIRN